MWRKTKIFMEMIKIEHTLFALPFAFMGALLGSVVVYGHLPSWATIGWILLAMVGARSAAMGLNRVIDKVFDAKNPRTAMRAIPAGLISSKEAILFILISFLLLFYAAFHLSPLAVKLLPVAVFFLVFYSYTKRFTWACHLVLGMTVALAPLGGWVAVTGEFSLPALVFYVAIVFWLAGFDIIYACQDAEFDREEGLHSIPSRFGIPKALKMARWFHIITAIGLISLYFLTELTWVYLLGIIVSYALLMYEHFIVKPDDLSRVNTAFFTMNSTLSIAVFAFTLIDLVVHTG
ncbi:UbiA-like polyprenyltransferase [Paenibacillus mucilaginosus]|uniref:4-hydroxybenzoate polyprenyltransferase n=3 Tax=Paenibacillus mucilaginosus TaxID=61624 RepID=H6NAG7_9BACL|nr:UbiA-like polyprenyltransferase [Paenibacillus mucilaginosus]AEI41342.1 4-hydroxybenzoate octaprenyltransferase [Paenibacillus mucilaginosus KNP414]AFC29892.1 4-hydroxybenzoate octaprenyltransferase [Paenibacillus mucilaginosus 3016]AFH62077.1 prenyltransferase [Paenibacillus mucilaginosus K02]MCG7211237.1 putative 4-hydroxybenzoate polyprenyltransferase [Paenibacillus mucilaginosus]WDM30369.1 putative 4-hydroxybenzoate polyprenyltransferase [Paenibacillus mucilaginosus]